MQQIISTKINDQNRLEALYQVCDPAALDMLSQIDINLHGKVIADFGCRTGIMSCKLAKLVGSSGKIIAIDTNQEQLKLARNHALQQQITNIDFIHVPNWALDNLTVKFDLIFSRFLLEHLTNQDSVLQTMYNLLNPNGYLFCESVTSYNCVFSDPQSKAVNQWHEAISLQPKLNDSNFYIGKELFSRYIKLGITPIKYRLQQPVVEPGQTRADLFSIFENHNICNQYVEKGFYSANELDLINQEIRETALQKDILISFIEYNQIIGKKH